MIEAIDLVGKLGTFTESFAPRTVAAFNGHDVMVVKARGAFEWHSHAEADDFFLVLRGRLRIESDAGSVELGPGQLAVIPRGMRHRPVADGECHLLLIEPTGMPNTGDPMTAAPRRLA
jgi:mannose-6-phosphate isomerase-like protein (cupin superfamily)